MGTFIATLAIVVIAVFTALVWKINKRMEWLTAAMESHAQKMLEIKAHDNNIPVELWDPSIEPFPPAAGHREPCMLDKIYIGIPPEMRKNPPPSFSYQLGLFVRDFWEKPREWWDDFLRGKREVDD